VFGAIRLAQLVLPQMRTRRAGTIVNITLMGSSIHTPLGGCYHGTKFALEALSDCLRLEIMAFDIDIVVIKPGRIATDGGVNGRGSPRTGCRTRILRGSGSGGREGAACGGHLSPVHVAGRGPSE
jgi:short-subunit dehydrogenase